MSAPDFTAFNLAVVQHLGQRRGGQACLADLGMDPAIKGAWTDLSLPKTKKMVNILELRPDLFERCQSEKGAAMVKLAPDGTTAFESKSIPPMSAATAALVQSKKVQSIHRPAVTHLGIELPPVPANVTNPKEARTYFITCVLRCLAAQPELQAQTSQLGEIEDLKQAFAVGGLNRSYKMLEIIKERPDLLVVSSDAMRSNATVSLTNLGMAYAPGFVIPDPDASCPPPQQPKRLMYAQRFKGAGKGIQNQQSFGFQNTMPPRNDGLVSGGLQPAIAYPGMMSGMPGMGVPGMSSSSAAGTGFGVGGFGYSPY